MPHYVLLMNALTACMNALTVRVHEHVDSLHERVDSLHERVDSLHENTLTACMNALTACMKAVLTYGWTASGSGWRCCEMSHSAYLELRRTLRYTSTPDKSCRSRMRVATCSACSSLGATGGSMVTRRWSYTAVHMMPSYFSFFCAIFHPCGRSQKAVWRIMPRMCAFLQIRV